VQSRAPVPGFAAIAPSFEASDVPMLVIDDQRRCLGANLAACSLLGIGREAILQRRLDELAPAEWQREIEPRWDAFLRVGTQGGTFGFLRADVSPRFFGYFATAHAAQGNHLAVLAAPASTHDAPSSESTSRSLSDREREVLTLIATGRTGPAIAHTLNISPATVETHVRHCMEKLGAKNRPHAIALALYTRQITIALDAIPTKRPALGPRHARHDGTFSDEGVQ
jgi:DNA-binding CsgD family transcriptional regulator